MGCGEGIRVICAKHPTIRGHRLLEQRQGGIVGTERRVHITDGGLKPCLDLRLFSKRLELSSTLVERLSRGDLAAAGLPWIRCAEQADEKTRHLAGGGCFLVGSVAFRCDAARL